MFKRKIKCWVTWDNDDGGRVNVFFSKRKALMYFERFLLENNLDVNKVKGGKNHLYYFDDYSMITLERTIIN